MNAILKQAREVYKNRETEYYLETIRKTADELERLQAEHETLKKDVARYFETRNRLKTILPNANDITEFWALEEKLLKAGKEE